MKKIAFISIGILPVPATKGGAVETLITSLIRQNEIDKKLKFEVFSICDAEAESAAENYQYTITHFIKIANSLKKLDLFIYQFFKTLFPQKNYNQVRYIFQRLYFISECKKFLLENDYDEVIVENHPSLLLILKDSKITEKYKGKIVYHLHNEINSTYMCEKQLHKVDRFFSVSNAITDRVSKKYFLDKSKFVLLKNCIDINRFNNKVDKGKVNQIRQKYEIKEDERIIIFAGRLVKEKGVDTLIKAFVELNVPNLKLLIVGGVSYTLDFCSEYEKELHNMANENVIFTGFVPYSQIHHFYHTADVGVFPSVWFEPAGLTIVEAMACGLPVITVDTGGIPEYTGNGAILLKNDENLEISLKETIVDLLTNKNQTRKLKMQAKNSIKDFSEEKYYKDFLKHIF